MVVQHCSSQSQSSSQLAGLGFSGHQRHFLVQIYVFPGKPLVQNANFPTIQCYFFAVFTCSLTFVYTNKYNFLVTSKLIYTVISIDTYQNEIIFKDFRLRPSPMCHEKNENIINVQKTTYKHIYKNIYRYIDRYIIEYY